MDFKKKFKKAKIAKKKNTKEFNNNNKNPIYININI